MQFHEIRPASACNQTRQHKAFGHLVYWAGYLLKLYFARSNCFTHVVVMLARQDAQHYTIVVMHIQCFKQYVVVAQQASPHFTLCVVLLGVTHKRLDFVQLVKYSAVTNACNAPISWCAARRLCVAGARSTCFIFKHCNISFADSAHQSRSLTLGESYLHTQGKLRVHGAHNQLPNQTKPTNQLVRPNI